MDCTSHFVGVTAKSLSRLSTLIEQAAALLDERGGRRLRTAIVKETHFALGALQAADNSVRGFGLSGVEPSAPLATETDRMGQLKGGITPRPALRLVINNGGDDAA
jgi:hypothetical protein